jgi:GEVED domain/Secretion system C-terminal sorting domain/Domain of unknown function DUF11
MSSATIRGLLAILTLIVFVAPVSAQVSQIGVAGIDAQDPITNSDFEPSSETGTLFENTDVGAFRTRTYRISNTGSGGVTVSDVSFDEGLEEFEISGISLPAQLAEGESVTFDVTFAPLDAGYTQDVIVVDSDADNSEIAFAIAGSGLMDFGDYGFNFDMKSAMYAQGARHVLTGPVLGTLRDGETGEIQCCTGKTANDEGLADRDDLDGEFDDEDGVIFPFYDDAQLNKTAVSVQTALLASGASIELTVEMSNAASAYLNVWLDWAEEECFECKSAEVLAFADGDFNDDGELLVMNALLVEGSNTVVVQLPDFFDDDDPAKSASDDGVYSAMRFRVSSDSYVEPLPDVFAADGEVEDHPVLLSTEPRPQNELGVRSADPQNPPISDDSDDPSPEDGTLFENTDVGASRTQTYRIYNAGSEALTVSNVILGSDYNKTVSSAEASEFAISGISFPVGLPVDGEVTFDLTFTPLDAGYAEDDIVVFSDAEASTFAFAVAGSGLMDFGDYNFSFNSKSAIDGLRARHVLAGPVLGTLRDGETGEIQCCRGDKTANDESQADRDDLDGEFDDEDGVIFPIYDDVQPRKTAFSVQTALLPSGAGIGATVEMSNATSGYLSVWLDWAQCGSCKSADVLAFADGDFNDEGELLIMNAPLSAGSNTVFIQLPEFFDEEVEPKSASDEGVYSAMRFRVTSEAYAEPSPYGFAEDGEVEDHPVLLSTEPIPLVITGTGGGSISVDEDGNIVQTNAAGEVIAVLDPDLITEITIMGDETDETVEIDEDVLNIPGLIINVELGGGFDTLVITQTTGTTTLVVHNFTGSTSGSFTTDGGGTVNYTGIDPIVDNLGAATRVFNFKGGTEEIVLNADGDGVAGNGYSYIDSNLGESITFLNPTESIIIDGESGTDTFTIGELDTPLAGTFAGVIVTGYDKYVDATGALQGAPTDFGEVDIFVVTPSASYPIDIDGGDPAATCPGDALSLDLSGGAVVGTFTNVAGTGTYTFSSGEGDVTFASIEAVGETDVAVTVNYETLYATQDLTTAAANELVITVTNSGAYDANCVTVELSLALVAWLDGAADVASSGALAGTTWSVGTVAPGTPETLTITGFVVPPSPQDLTFTSSAAQDTNADNDVASVALSFGFTMPAKTQVNSALYYSKAVSGPDSYEALILGLYQGAPGIEGAVWCKIPDAPVGSWPTIAPGAFGDAFRPCSNGLPFPLHVNDLFQDDSGTLWLATWGSGGLYSSEDGGESWTNAEPVLGPKGGWANVYTIIEDAATGVLYISANNGLVFRSFNDGVSWQQVSSLPGAASDTPWSMAAHPSAAGTVYAGTFGNGVFVSEDFGFTWEELDYAVTLLVNENDALLDIDGSGEDFAGHIFDLEFSPDNDCGAGNDACHLYAGTGNGVWRANIGSGTIEWTLMGPDLDPGVDVVLPEVRTLAFVDNSPGSSSAVLVQDDDLVIGTWGSGAFIDLNPARGMPVDAFAELALRGSEITFVAVSQDGTILLGDTAGGTTLVTAAEATSTASEPEPTVELPDGFALGQNYPNPFNPVTTIGFALPKTGKVRLSVFDALGREVALLVDGTIQAGQHEVQFSAGSLPTGAYLYRLHTEAGTISRTLVLMK